MSCKTRKGIPTLQELLIKLASQEKYVNVDYPASYHQLEELLQSQRNLRTPPVISMSEFRDMCTACDITAAGEAVAAAKLMNELGVIVFFNDSKFGLDNLIILDPQWLTRLMSTLITTKPNFVKNGVLLSTNLTQIWKPPEFPESLHMTLLSLLEKFEISFPLPSKDHEATRNFIPYLVIGDRPENLLVDQHKEYAARAYKFDFLPFGFFSRLVVCEEQNQVRGE